MKDSASALDLNQIRSNTDNIESDQQHETKTETKVKQKWQIILEPALIGSILAINLGQTSFQNFYLRTACMIDLKYPAEICESGVGATFQNAEDQSQLLVTNTNIGRSLLGSTLATIVLMFVGPWSDRSGRRKPLIIMSLLGMSAMSTLLLLMLTFPGASTSVVLYTVQIAISIGGNFGLLLTASFSYIGDICFKKGLDVTKTMGIHRASIQVASVFGTFAGPRLYHAIGFYGVFSIVLLLQISSLIYVLVTVKDVNVHENNDISVCNWRQPYDAFSCLFKPRKDYRRFIIILMILIALGDRFLLSAEVLLSYMFFRKVYQWDDIIFGSFLAYKNVVSFFGTVIILLILKRSMRLSDETVGVASCISFVVSSAGLISAPDTTAVLITPIVGIIAQGSQVVQRPILNKQISPNEQGKIYSIMGALEAATQILTSPLFSLLYKHTVTTMPYAWLIPGLIVGLLQIVFFLIAKILGLQTCYDDGDGKTREKQKTEEEVLLNEGANSCDKNNTVDEMKRLGNENN